MKLKDLLKDIFSNGPLPQETTFTGGFDDYCLDRYYLEMFKDMILECEEFEEVDNLIITQYPVFENDNGQVNAVKNYLMTDGVKFKDSCYLYSISLTPQMYDPTGKWDYVKNNALITPTQYDRNTFTPLKEFRIAWSPELAQDVRGWSLLEQEISLRERLHQTLDDMIDNPHEYQVHGIRKIMIRGILNYDITETGNEYTISL